MGQAKARREAVRKKLLDQGAQWDFPPSKWEAGACCELLDLPAYWATRMSRHDLDLMQMPLNECHANARWYSKNYPGKNCRMVSGWFVENYCFILHSLVKIEEAYICVTPVEFSEEKFLFIPDSKIVWIENGDVLSPVRDGQKVGPGLRQYPAFTMAQNENFRNRLLAGIDPVKAMRDSREEFDELKRKYIENIDN